ncbi:MAG TPA: Sir2 silent information regulator family NAD-dependent deacetylase [Candidatus Mediterraneibacter merdipullorum]|nr:Sir2 silent information regulator family NAD-dependent deacetylase [Candidatus Mediterraneibacter merdipullorum]
MSTAAGPARDGDAPDGISKLREAIASADVIIIGAGAGLSASAGLVYTGERFEKYFGDFASRYHFRDMYSGGFYPFDTLEEYWAYWSRYIYINRYMDAPKPVYRALYDLVKDKDYFVLTTNVDHCFQKAGFDRRRLFYTQGDYGLFQCSVPCHQGTYDNAEIIRKMIEAQGYVTAENGEIYLPEGIVPEMKIPPELVPCCPKCGKPVSMNLRADDTFVEDEGWHRAAQRYSDFLHRHQNRRTLFLEAAVGFNTPTIVKYSFWRMAYEWKDALYACLNYGEAFAPDKIKKKSICINGDIGAILNQLQPI